MNIGVVIFPGSNCDRDVKVAFEAVGANAEYIWHKETEIKDYDIIVLPGGFSYGDIGGVGKMAAASPVTAEIMRKVKRGATAIGICNGFQILVAMGLLPGSFKKNRGQRFIHKQIKLIADNENSFFSCFEDKNIIMPIAHHSGKYDCSDDTLNFMIDEGMVALRYKTNPNGSKYSIAGLCNKEKTVLGMMPHPERMYQDELNGTDGMRFLQHLIGI